MGRERVGGSEVWLRRGGCVNQGGYGLVGHVPHYRMVRFGIHLTRSKRTGVDKQFLDNCRVFIGKSDYLWTTLSLRKKTLDVANRETLRNSRYSTNQSQKTVLGERTIWIPILILTKISASLVVTQRNRVNPLEKRCEDLKLLRCLIRPSLRHEKHRSFLFSRLDLLNRTDPGESVRNVEYIL
jgi:hypothetical protein